MYKSRYELFSAQQSKRGQNVTPEGTLIEEGFDIAVHYMKYWVVVCSGVFFIFGYIIGTLYA